MSEKYVILGIVALSIGAFVYIKASQVNIAGLTGPAGAAANSGAGSTPGTGDTNVDTAANPPS